MTEIKLDAYSITLEEIIRTYVSLPNLPNGSGFFPVLCKVCGDRGHKGMRAGFKFDNGACGYHCFNCGAAAKYDPSSHNTISKNMKIVLDKFDIPSTEWKKVLFANLKAGQVQSDSTKPPQLSIQIEPTIIDVPPHFYKLADANPDDVWAVIASDYLSHNRGVSPSDYPFYLSDGGTTTRDRRWVGRLIIPVYKGNKLVYYQGRDLTGKRKAHLSPDVPKDKIIYGIDLLFENQEIPLYVVEGWFDAYHINGVAVYGNRLSKEQVVWLSRSRREKVIIPDRRGDGHRLADQAIELGWSVSLPSIGGAKDVSEAVSRFGKLYVLQSIAEHTYSGFAAQAHVRMMCRNA